MKSLLLMAAAMPLMLSIGCNNGAFQKEARAPADNTTTDKAPVNLEAGRSLSMTDTATAPGNTGGPAGQPPATTGNAPSHTAANPDWDKKIVRNASLHVEVKDFKRYTEQLHQKVRAAGGYIAQEEQDESTYKIENAVVIKIPVDRFDETLMQLASDSDKLVSKKVSTEDVTMQIVDTKSRLETRKQVRERYVEMLKQSHSREDIVQTQHEIDDLQTEIEGATGRIAYLGHAAAFSTINLNFYQVLDASVKNDVEPSFLQKLSNAFRAGWFWVSGLMIGLVGLWPLLLAGVLGLMWWKSRRLAK